jgi:uroporphyrinogen decarboxylase
VPIALWRHFPGADLVAQDLAERVVSFQEQYDWDFVKVTPAAGYPAEMYGAELGAKGNREGTRNYVTRPVNHWGEWEKIGPLDSTNRVFRREHQAMELIRGALGNRVPVLQTIFSPLSIARNLRGDDLVNDLHEHPRELALALEGITLTVIRFALDSLSAGADALFFATQMASSDYVTEQEYRQFGERYDWLVLDAVRGHPDFVLLHAHGENLYFDLLTHYPVDAVNWHDRKTSPSLKQARDKFSGALVGGIDEWGVLADGTPDQIRAQVNDAMGQTNGLGLILAPGCVISTDTSVENIRAARDSVG